MSGAEIHRDMEALRLSIGDVCQAAYSVNTRSDGDDLPSPAALVLTCELPAGHKGSHSCGAFTWTRYEAAS